MDEFFTRFAVDVAIRCALTLCPCPVGLAVLISCCQLLAAVKL